MVKGVADPEPDEGIIVLMSVYFSSNYLRRPPTRTISRSDNFSGCPTKIGPCAEHRSRFN